MLWPLREASGAPHTRLLGMLVTQGAATASLCVCGWHAGAATGDAVATFDQVGVLVPRGRFDIEMYMASLKLVGQVSRYAQRHQWRGREGWAGPRAGLPPGLCMPRCSARMPRSGRCPRGRPLLKSRRGSLRPSAPLHAGAGLPHPLRLDPARLPAAQDQRAADAGGHLAGPAHPQGQHLLPPHPLPGGVSGGGQGGPRRRPLPLHPAKKTSALGLPSARAHSTPCSLHAAETCRVLAASAPACGHPASRDSTRPDSPCHPCRSPKSQFPSDEEAEVELDISDEALAAKNERCGGRLARSFRGPAFEVFAKVLRGLSGAKLTKPGTFRDAEGTGFAVRCSYKARQGR